MNTAKTVYYTRSSWVPAFAGMTLSGTSAHVRRRLIAPDLADLSPP
jgi:hypothetical protein